MARGGAVWVLVILVVWTGSVQQAYAQNECDSLQECDFFPWQAWSSCSQSCGATGSRTRAREICCDKSLSADECISRCNITVSDGSETGTCGETCENGGMFALGKCICVGGFSGKCCDIAPPTTAGTTTTTTPRPTTTERLCQNPVDVPDPNIKSSSNEQGKTPVMAKSVCHAHPCGWCPDPSLPIGEQWLEFTFKEPWYIQAIEIQPPEGTTPGAIIRNYMTNYTFQYQPVGGTKLVTYGREKSGPLYNIGVTGIQSQSLVSTLTEIQKVIAVRARIQVVDAQNKACFRYKFFGCKPLCNCENGGLCISDNTCLCPPPYYGPSCHYIHLPEKGGCLRPLGLWNNKITVDQLTVSSSAPDHGTDKIGYICCRGERNGAWCPASNDSAPFFEVNLKKPNLVAMFMFAQPNVEHVWEKPDSYLKTFTLHYNNLETGKMEQYAQGIDAIKDASVSYSPILDPYIYTDVIRIVPETWVVSPCFRLEVIGCDPDEGLAGAAGVPQNILGRRRRDTLSFVVPRQN